METIEAKAQARANKEGVTIYVSETFTGRPLLMKRQPREGWNYGSFAPQNGSKAIEVPAKATTPRTRTTKAPQACSGRTYANGKLCETHGGLVGDGGCSVYRRKAKEALA